MNPHCPPSPINGDLGYGDDHAMEDLGYGECDKPTPIVANLGYGEPVKDLGYGDHDDLPMREIKAVAEPQRAVQIRNGKRISMLCPYANTNGRTDSFYDSSDYDDSSVDYDSEDDDSWNEESVQDMTDLTEDFERMEEAPTPHMPSKVNMEFEGNSTTPRRISLAFSQHKQHQDGRISTRTGCLEVSIGTSRLPRRRATVADDQNVHEERDIIRGLKKNHSNLTVSTRPMRRLSIEDRRADPSSGGRPTRRITMNLSSRPSRRGSLGKPTVSRQSMAPARTLSGEVKRSPLRRRRPTMEHSTPTVPLSTQATRRISMDMSQASPNGPQRRITMNLSKSILPRATPASTASSKDKQPRRRTCAMPRSA